MSKTFAHEVKFSAGVVNLTGLYEIWDLESRKPREKPGDFGQQSSPLRVSLTKQALFAKIRICRP
jgi:hypothetical protein